MRKTSAYARRARREQRTWNAAEWLNTITKCRPYDPEPLPGAIATETSYTAAEKAIVNVRRAFEAIKLGTATKESWDKLTHATGVTKIRSVQIAGDGNDIFLALEEADAALMKVKVRYQKWGKWEVLPKEVQDIAYGLDLYEMVLTRSSPAQMAEAADIREQILKKQRETA